MSNTIRNYLSIINEGHTINEKDWIGRTGDAIKRKLPSNPFSDKDEAAEKKRQLNLANKIYNSIKQAYTKWVSLSDPESGKPRVKNMKSLIKFINLIGISNRHLNVIKKSTGLSGIQGESNEYLNYSLEEDGFNLSDVKTQWDDPKDFLNDVATFIAKQEKSVVINVANRIKKVKDGTINDTKDNQTGTQTGTQPEDDPKPSDKPNDTIPDDKKASLSPVSKKGKPTLASIGDDFKKLTDDEQNQFVEYLIKMKTKGR